jgi:negative regulator of sigma E activity
MTDIADLQISAFVDDELSSDECEFLVRRLSRDADARRQLLRYQTVGAAMRGELLGPDPDILRRRISAALEGVHLPIRPEPAPPRTYHRYTRPALGAAIAASVAIAALAVLRVGPGENDTDVPTVAVSGQTSTSPATSVASDFRSVSSDLTGNPVQAVPASYNQYSITMTDYIVQHSQYAPGIRRHSINSSVAGEQHYYRSMPVSQTNE